MSPTRRSALRLGLGTLAALPLQRSLLPASEAAATQALQELLDFGHLSGEECWTAVRRCFALPAEVAYFNNGSLGPTPLPVLQDLAGFARELAASPAPRMWGPLGARLEEVRGKAAALLGVAPDDVALTRNTTEGISTVGMGLGLAPGDEVITTDQEHPGGSGVWQYLETRGIRRIAVPLSLYPMGDIFLESLAAAITPKTRVLALPHLTFGSGHLLPLKQIADLARKRNLLFCVDGAHPPGMMPLDLRSLGCDTYASSSHKWLCAPPGTGLLYVSPAARERIAPRVFTGTGFTGKTARRYDDFGTRNLAEVLAQGSAIDFHQRVGTDRVWFRIRALSAQLRDGLESIRQVRILTPKEEGRPPGGLTAFRMEGIPHKAIADFLGDKPQCVVRPVPELDAVRVSTAIYNLPPEIDRLLTAVKQLAVSFRA